MLVQIARTDRTFVQDGPRWIGKCLICNGRLAFDSAGGHGATIEHIIPRSRGGSNDLHNLGLTHPACNHEKGVHWDTPRSRRADPERYTALVDRLLEERRRRWRDPSES